MQNQRILVDLEGNAEFCYVACNLCVMLAVQCTARFVRYLS